MGFFEAINPLQNLAPVLAQNALREANGTTNPQKQFAKIFVAEILKQSLAGLSSIAETENNKQFLFPGYNSAMFNRVLVEQVGEELINSGAFNLKQVMPNTDSTNWRQIINKARQTWLRK